MTITLPPRAAPDAVDILEKSGETMEWLRANIKVGFTDQLGPAWWANGAVTKDRTWDIIPDGSHFPGAVPMPVVVKLLSSVPFVKGTVHVTYTDADGNKQVTTDENTQPIVNALTGQVFSYPKAGYKIHPYLETLHTFIQAIQLDAQAEVYSVGLLKGGGQAFLTAVLPETMEVEGYGYQPFLMGATSVDLSRSTTLTAGAIGGVCDNTVTRAIAEALAKFKIRHTSEIPPVQIARDKLGLRLADVGQAIGDAISALAGVDVSDADFALWLDEVQPRVKPDPKSATGGLRFTNAEAKRNELTRLWTEDPKVAPWAGTAFGVLQLDNTYRTWAGKVTGKGGRIEQNYRRLVRGDTEAADARALEILARVQGRKAVMA
jgi:phage/plasmid-like protein (TIGR03299 family)